MYGILPKSLGKHFPIAQITQKSLFFAFCRLSRLFHVCFSIENGNINVIGNNAKNRVFVAIIDLQLTPSASVRGRKRALLD